MKKTLHAFYLVLIILLLGCTKNSTVVEPIKIVEEEIAEPIKKISTNDILSKFQEWEGKKNPGENIYTLNYNNDEYILTIVPQSNQTLKWADMYYFKDIDKEDITFEDLKPMDDLASVISIYWDENKQWIDKFVKNELPYEEVHDSYTLFIDRYIYKGTTGGIYFKIVNNDKQISNPSKEQSLKEAYINYSADKESAWIFAQDAVKANLKAPSSAKFPWYNESYITVSSDGNYVVQAYVDAENSLGAQIRSNFSVRIVIKGEYNYTYSDLIIE